MKKIIAILFITLCVFSLHAQMFWNQAAKFENGSYIACPNTLSLNIIGSVTVEAWVYPQTNTGIRYIVFKGNASNGYYLRLNSNGTLSFGTDGINRITSTSVVPANKWSHVAGTYNVSTDEFAIYVNGLEEGTLVSDNAPNNNTDSLFIGKFGASVFTGMIDEVRIWTKSVSSEDIRRNFRTSLTLSSGKYTSLLFSMPFQRVNSSGTHFAIQDLSLNPISGNPAYNRGVTALDLSNKPSTYLSSNEGLLLEGNFDSYAAMPSTVLNNMTGAMTLEAWINLAGPSMDVNYIFHKNAVGGNGYRIQVNAQQKIGFSINNAVFSESSSIIEYNKWYHLAWVVSAAGGSSLYINGNLDAFFSSTGTPQGSTDSLYIGRGFNGVIDEARVFKFERSQADIKRFMFESIDEVNAPSGDCFAFNFDGSAWANKNFQVFFLRGNTYFTSSINTNHRTSPLMRADNINFHEGFYKKVSNRRIPETGSSGLMIDDSITIPDNVNISDVNLYLSFLHGAGEQLQVTLISPTGQSVQVMNGYLSLGTGLNFTTIFDDQADSSLVSNTYIQVLSNIRPQANLNSTFSGNNSGGVWKLRINDLSGLETGQLLAWGLQINNSAVIGIQNISAEIPEKFSMGQNYPNPFNPNTNISLNIAKFGFVSLKVYDITGREAAVLVKEELMPGVYKVDFDGSNLASGIYFYKLEVRQTGSSTDGFTDVKKMILVK